MDLEKASAIITKYNVDGNGNPVSVNKTETQQIHPTKNIIESNIMDEFNRVEILNKVMYEVNNLDEVKSSNQYFVDYNNGRIYFHPSLKGQSIQYRYGDVGKITLSANNVFTKVNDLGEVIEFLSDFIDRVEDKLNEFKQAIEDVQDAETLINQLHTDVAEGKVLEPELKKTVTNANTSKVELDKSLVAAQEDIATIKATGNTEILILASEWTLNNGIYEKQITHDLNSDNAHISARNSDTKESVTIGYKIVDKSKILLKSDEAINMSVVLNASYYKPMVFTNVDEGEIVRARKGEASLDVKIGKIDSSLEYNTNQINLLKPQVQSLASGSPKDVYATTTALTTAFPSGNTNIYVVSADGGWYYWGGSSWLKGGTYQSSGIGDKTVTPKKTTFLNQTKNLFNKLTVKQGYYWNVTTGEQVNSAFSYAIIPCEDNKTYITTGTNYNVSIFNASGTRIGGDNNSNGLDKCVVSTVAYTGTSYFIINFRQATYPIDTYMVAEGNIYPSTYVSYGFVLDESIFIKKENALKVIKDGTGDFTTVYGAIKYAEQYANKDNVYNIYIYDTSTNYQGTSFDVLSEMGGDNYLATITTTTNNQLGMPLKDYINLIGVGKVKLYAYLPDTCTLAQSTCFSTIDIFGEATLENLTIEIKNGRYPVHDESNNIRPNKKHKFKKCKFVHLGNKSGLWSSQHAYAGGTSGGNIYEYEDCVFDTSTSNGYPWDIHNYAPQLGSKISFNGCTMIKSSGQPVSLKFGFNGYSPVTSNPTLYEACFIDVFIKNIIADGTIQVANETTSYDCTNNYRLYNFTGLTTDIKPNYIKP